MRTRWTVCCALLLTALMLLGGCGKKALVNTEWTVIGSVDDFGAEQAMANVNGMFATLELAFFEGDAGALRMEGATHPFTVEKDGNDLRLLLADGLTLNGVMSGDTIYLTIGTTTLYFAKR
jgi:hypothetical protein